MSDEPNLSTWSDPDEILQELQRLGKAVRPELYETVAALLVHGDSDIREEALRCLSVRWKDVRVRNAALRCLRNDPEEAVRATAAFGLAAIAGGAGDEEVEAGLIGTVKDEHESAHVRGAAYEALLILHKRPAFPPLNRMFNPTSDIDWSWISQLT